MLTKQYTNVAIKCVERYSIFSICADNSVRARSESLLYVVIAIKLGMFPPEVCSWHDLHEYYS